MGREGRWEAAAHRARLGEVHYVPDVLRAEGGLFRRHAAACGPLARAAVGVARFGRGGKKEKHCEASVLSAVLPRICSVLGAQRQ